ncbi:pyranose oxidase [Hypoxylon crocopeplum]|nr:pyranose oxidase [Hypoxylon crocopeplum]
MSQSNPIPSLPGKGPISDLVKRIQSLRDNGQVVNTDVLIVGSGPIGAVFARTLLDAGLDVVMVDMGEQASKLIGDHRKNSVAVQKDISLFTNVIRGELSPLSVPVKEANVSLAPISFQDGAGRYVLNGQNPDQDARLNLTASAATRTVGGMSSHWTCCTPRQHPKEHSDLFTDREWDGLYAKAEDLFDTNSTTFDGSVRHRLVRKVLAEAFGDEREVRSMPLACKKPSDKSSYIQWSSTASILGKYAQSSSKPFRVMSQTQCDVLKINRSTFEVETAIIRDLVNNVDSVIDAKRYVICGGAVLTAGIMARSLWKSDLNIEGSCPALGKFLTEQHMTFCQIALKQSLVERVSRDPGWLDTEGDSTIKKAVEKHKLLHPDDPLPFPFHDLDPNVYTPFSEAHPWHTQIHRDAFGYGEIPDGLDQRLVVDLRFFGYTSPTCDNKVTFSEKRRDGFGMPQPTFDFRLSKEDRERDHNMMQDMEKVAALLGGFVPGSEPQNLASGTALHVCGVYRAGKRDDKSLDEVKETSVVDRYGRVWGSDNLYLGGCGVIPTGNASNPTLTAAVHALAGAEQIVTKLLTK